MGEVRHGGGVAASAMEHQHQRHRAGLWKRLWNVQQIHPVHAADADMHLFVVSRRSSGGAVRRRKAATECDDGNYCKKSDSLPHDDFLGG